LIVAAPFGSLTVDRPLDDTQDMHPSLQEDAEMRRLLGRLEQLVSANDLDPRRRLLASLIAMWDDDPRLDNRLEAAQHLLTLDQRDVWFVADDPVTALDDAASRLLVALGDAITAAGANFYFDAGEPFIPAGHADDAYLELGDAIRHWKAQMLDEQRRRQQRPPVESEEPT
jgi:hypothetical protein